MLKVISVYFFFVSQFGFELKENEKFWKALVGVSVREMFTCG